MNENIVMSVFMQGLLNSPKVLTGEKRGKCVGEQQVTTVQELRGKLFVR